MRLKNKLQTPATAGKKPKPRFSPTKAAYYAFLSSMMFLMFTQPAYAADVCGRPSLAGVRGAAADTGPAGLRQRGNRI